MTNPNALSDTQQHALTTLASWRNDPSKEKLFTALLSPHGPRLPQAQAIAREIYRGDIGALPADIAGELVKRHPEQAARVLELDTMQGLSNFGHADAARASKQRPHPGAERS